MIASFRKTLSQPLGQDTSKPLRFIFRQRGLYFYAADHSRRDDASLFFAQAIDFRASIPLVPGLKFL